MKHLRRICSGFAITSLLLTSGCALNQKLDVQAEAGRPESAQVEQISLPYDRSKPRFALVVERFEPSQVTTTVAFNQVQAVPIGDQLAAQLTTALSNVGNFSLYDSRQAGRIKPEKGEKGPYLLRATLSEFNETAEAEAENSGVSLGTIGIVAGVAGAIAGKPGLLWSGAGLAAANPGYEESTATRKGMVAFDVQIVDQRTGRIVGAFEASGTFKAESAANGISLFGISNAKAKFASSAVGQALRAAMNDAVTKTLGALD